MYYTNDFCIILLYINSDNRYSDIQQKQTILTNSNYESIIQEQNICSDLIRSTKLSAIQHQKTSPWS